MKTNGLNFELEIQEFFSDMAKDERNFEVNIVPEVKVFHKKVKNKPTYGKNVKFSYYGDIGDCNNHDGIIVIVSDINDALKAVFYGVAYCSPYDVYNKAIGKSIAIADMRYNMNVSSYDKKSHHEINARIFADIVANNSAPSWAKEMVANELCEHLANSFFK